ncbi:MarR family winged helix-turn-helix transcriptional regulator [Pseudonocardia sichuanensis]
MLRSLGTAPGHLIRRAQQVNERIWQVSVGAGLTSVQYGVLLALAAQPGMDQRSIGEVMSLDKSNVADVVLRLGRRGLVVRDRHPDDARRKLVRLTPEGLAALAEASPGAVQVQEEVMASLSPVESATCLTLLRLVAFRGQPPPPPPAGEPVDVPGWPPGLPVVQLPTAPGHLIRRAQQVHTVLWSDHVGTQLTSVQYVVLLVLYARPDIDQRTLGEHASLDKSTGGEILTRMVARGLVGRSRDLSDGRRNLLHLTAAGRAEVLRHAEAVTRVQLELLRPLTEPQRQQFLSLMRAVAMVPPST